MLLQKNESFFLLWPEISIVSDTFYAPYGSLCFSPISLQIRL